MKRHTAAATFTVCLLLLSAAAVHCQLTVDNAITINSDVPVSAPAQTQTVAPPAEQAAPPISASRPEADLPTLEVSPTEAPAVAESPAADSTLTAAPAAESVRSNPAVTAADVNGQTSGSCPPYFDTGKYRTTNFTNTLNTTTQISPLRPKANVPTGEWIMGRATFYGTDERVEASRVACGETPGQFGVIAQGSCGYTNSDGSLPFSREVYAANADTNVDYPGSCGRCYQVRCRSGAPLNNGRPMRVSDLIYYRPYQIKDNFGEDWPGNPKLQDDLFYTVCRDEEKVITVRIGDSCPCQYPIRDSNGTVKEVRTQNWCCGGNNHFDLSFWAFEQLAHPSYGVMPIEYRPVNCDTGTPLRPVPGFVNQTIYSDSIQPGWNWLPYNAKNSVLIAEGQGVNGSNATCSTLSQGGAVEFQCRQCSRPGYQPFAKADFLRFDIRSNTWSTDKFASSTPPGELPPLKLFLMNANNKTYCGAEVILSDSNATATGNGTLVPVAEYAETLPGSSADWFRVTIPLAVFACDQGSVGNLTRVDRVDFQNINIRDADVCLDNIQLV